MLKHLTIKNYALIRHLEMNPSEHLSVITGETGAGKSIMLGAMGLLMGNRADTKVLWDEQEKCIIEGTFAIGTYNLKTFFSEENLDYDEQTVIRREISPGGKSRAFINDTPVTLEVMRKLGQRLMDIHSQHETLELAQQRFQLQLIDGYAGNAALREQYLGAWADYVKAKKNYDDLNREAASLRQEADYVLFQLDELVKAGLQPDEQLQLEAEQQIMEHAEEIKSRFNLILKTLNDQEFSATHALGEARSNLQAIASYSPAYESLFSRLESLRIELDDIAQEIEREEEKIEFDPERSEFVRERLNTIYRLQAKHRVSDIASLLELQQSLQKKADLTTNLDDALASAKETLDNTEKKVQEIALQVSETRKKAFEPLKRQLTGLLKELGIPDASLVIEREVASPGPSGADKIEVLFSANKGIDPRPLAQVASGGEFSRLMFGIKYILAGKSAMPTLVLDEIDNGVSGEIAIRLGNLMTQMAERHQLITISHLPQIAAKGSAHYFVYKDNRDKKTVSNIRLLSETERVEEIAKMIGGSKPSRVALENAQELLAR